MESVIAKMDIVYYDKAEPDTGWECEVRLGDDGHLVISYQEEDSGHVVYEGDGDLGHFELTCTSPPNKNGWATLHHLDDSSELEGMWTENGNRGFWVISLPSSLWITKKDEKRNVPMKIILETEDFQRLSTAARDEILKLATGSKVSCNEEDPYGAADLTPALAKKFMAGVSVQTKELLKVFVDNGGRASYSQLLKQQGKYDDWRKLRGFFSGVTRRTRKILQDNEAQLLIWDENTAGYDEEGELLDGEYVMSSMTVKALNLYFNS